MEYGIKNTITREGMLNLFHTCLTSLDFYNGALSIDCDKSEYTQAKERLKERSPNEYVCVEDIYREVLNGYGTIEVSEYDEYDDVNNPVGSFDINDLIENFENVEPYFVAQILDGQDDACTHDAILQTLFLGEVVYG